MPLFTTEAAAGSIVVGLDQSESARAVLATARDIARHLGVGCHVVNVWEYPALAMSPFVAIPVALDDVAHSHRAYLDRVLAASVGDDVRVTREVIHGLPGPALVDVASRLDAPFLVVGSVGHGAIVGALLGSVSLHCVHHARCPVIVVPPADRAAPDA